MRNAHLQASVAIPVYLGHWALRHVIMCFARLDAQSAFWLVQVLF